MPPRRWIAHLDMDAFYASVELLRYPDLAGQAVVIGGGRRHQPVQQADGTRRYATLAGYTGRGVVTTATYPARDLGVHSGLGLMKAAQRAPDAILLPMDFDAYRRYSRMFKAAVAEVAPVIEDRGIQNLHRPHRRARRAGQPGARPGRRRARGGAGDPQHRQARDGPVVFDRGDAEQAAVQDRQRTRQA
jgi:hypothetical protein